MNTGEKAGPQISPKNDQNAKRSLNLSKTFDRTCVIKIGRYLQTSADKGPLEIGVTSAIRHSSGNSPERNNLRKTQLSFGARTEAVFRKDIGKQPDWSTPPFRSVGTQQCLVTVCCQTMYSTAQPSLPDQKQEHHQASKGEEFRLRTKNMTF